MCSANQSWTWRRKSPESSKRGSTKKMVLPSRLSSRGAIGFGVTFGAYPTGFNTGMFSAPFIPSGMCASSLRSRLNCAASERKSFPGCELYAMRSRACPSRRRACRTLDWRERNRFTWSRPDSMEIKVRAVALLGLVTCRHFSHRVVGWRAAVLGVCFYAVPFDHHDDPARVFDAGEEFDAMGPGVIGFLQDIAEDFDVLIAFFRRDMLD